VAIIDDYASIAAELRRIKGEKPEQGEVPVESRNAGWHRMQATVAGDALYRRLVAPRGVDASFHRPP
jgi:hypothetical protein